MSVSMCMCLYEYISRETMIHSLLISRPLQSVLLVTLEGTRMGYETLPYSGHCAKTGNESSYNGINLELRRLGEKPVGRKTFGRIIFWATDDWATS